MSNCRHKNTTPLSFLCMDCGWKSGDGERDKLRAEVERLVMAEAEAMSLVMSHESKIEQLQVEVELWKATATVAAKKEEGT